jgi:hypothetical protein
MLLFMSSLYGRYTILFVLLISIVFSLYVRMKHSIEKSIYAEETRNAIIYENKALRSSNILISNPNWMLAPDKYERRAN